jgi:branched-chain amino acid transport system substrate-binding protein
MQTPQLRVPTVVLVVLLATGISAFAEEAGALDLGGFNLAYSATSNRGSDQVFLTVIQADGSFKAVERLEKSGT